MNKRDGNLRKNQMDAIRLIPQLEEELAVLRKRKTALKGHGSSTVEVVKSIDEKQSQLRDLRKVLKRPIPKNAYTLSMPKKTRTLSYTCDAQKRPLQGGGISPR